MQMCFGAMGLDLSVPAQFPVATQHYWSSDKCTKPQASVLSWSQKRREKMSSYGSPLCHFCAEQKIESSRREKSDGWNASSKMEGKLQVNPQETFNIHANTPEGLDWASQFWNGSLFWVWLYLEFIFGLFPAGLFS